MNLSETFRIDVNMDFDLGLQNGVLRYGHFGEFLEFFFWDRIANLGPIDFKLGLYIKVNVNTGQNKFEVHISKTWPKWPSIGTK